MLAWPWICIWKSAVKQTQSEAGNKRRVERQKGLYVDTNSVPQSQKHWIGQTDSKQEISPTIITSSNTPDYCQEHLHTRAVWLTNFIKEKPKKMY